MHEQFIICINLFFINCQLSQHALPFQGEDNLISVYLNFTNASATLQHVIDSILRGVQNQKCLVYLDDIIVFSGSPQERISNQKSAFQR